MMEENLARLKSLSKKWHPNSPKKFNNKQHINAVHQIVFDELYSTQVPGFLIESKYFQNVLWKNFDQDASANHIELIMVLLSHTSCNNDIFGELLDDEMKLNELITRALSASQVVNENSNFKSLAITVKFISKISSVFYAFDEIVTKVMKPMFDINIWSNLDDYQNLLKTKESEELFETSSGLNAMLNGREKALMILKVNWISKLLKSALSYAASASTLTADSKEFIESLLGYLIQCCSNKNFLHFSTLVEQSNIPTLVRTIPNLNRDVVIVQLSHVLSFFSNTECSLSKLQQYVFENYPALEGLTEFISIPSTYSYPKQQLVEFLMHNFSQDQLATMLSALTTLNSSNFFTVNSDRAELVPIALSDLVYKHQFSRTAVLTEREVLDDFGALVKSPFPIKGINSTPDLLTRIIPNINSKVAFNVHEHISRVLTRIKVDSNLGIKGSSKYFRAIVSTKKVEFNRYEVLLSGSGDVVYDFIAVLELVKPNKYSPDLRVQTHGLNLVRIGTIVGPQETGNKRTKLIVSCSGAREVEAFEERINFAIFLPSFLSLKVLQNFISEPIESFQNMEEFFNTSKVVSSFELNDHSKKQRLSKENEKLEAAKENISKDDSESEVLDSIINENITVVSVEQYSGVERLITQSMMRFLAERTLIVVSSKNCVRNFPSLVEDLVKYGDSEYLHEIKTKIETSIKLIAGLFDFSESKFKFDIKNLGYYEKQIKLEWSNYLSESKDDKTKILQNFPLNRSAKYQKFQEIVADYTRILKSLDFLKRIAPVCDSILTSKKLDQVWAYLYNNCNVIINFEDYLELNNQKIVKNTFSNIYILNGAQYVFPIVMKKNLVEVNRLIILGGELVTLFAANHKVWSRVHQVYNVRSAFVLSSKAVIYNTGSVRGFNPGFKFNVQHLKVQNETPVDEIEYCVSLFQYMRLLGYPSLEIGICVSDYAQEALLKEVLSARCTSSPASNDTAKDFRFGWPGIVVASSSDHSFDCFGYCITSLFNSTDTTRKYGRLGNYYVGSVLCSCLEVPPNNQLEVTIGEDYASKECSQISPHVIEDGKHLQEYVSQMTRTRTAKKKSI